VKATVIISKNHWSLLWYHTN